MPLLDPLPGDSPTLRRSPAAAALVLGLVTVVAAASCSGAGIGAAAADPRRGDDALQRGAAEPAAPRPTLGLPRPGAAGSIPATPPSAGPASPVGVSASAEPESIGDRTLASAAPVVRSVGRLDLATVLVGLPPAPSRVERRKARREARAAEREAAARTGTLAGRRRSPGSRTRADGPAAEVPVPGPALRVIRLRPRPREGPFRMNLYRSGDFVHQQTKDWCVAGSTQTMMNIIRTSRPNRSASFQRHLYVKGRRLSPNKVKLGPIGVDLIGWADLLNTAGLGPYVVDGASTRTAAIKKAARALRMTGRPVGLVVWRGAHSWVMSGFTATADPATTRDFRVTSVYIQDVWYPYVSTIWGASRPPNARVPVSALGADFLPYRRPRASYPDRDGRYMLVMPELPPNTIVG